MWIMSREGFFSVVESSSDKTSFVVRARVKEDLENLRRFIPNIEVLEKGRDYPFRAIVPKEQFTEVLGKLTMEVDYRNFKDEIGKKDTFRARLFHDVWNTLLRLEKYYENHTVWRGMFSERSDDDGKEHTNKKRRKPSTLLRGNR